MIKVVRYRLVADAEARYLTEVSTSAKETPFNAEATRSNVEASPSCLDGGHMDSAVRDGLTTASSAATPLARIKGGEGKAGCCVIV